MTLSASELIIIKRMADSLEHLNSGVAELGIQLERLANSVEVFVQATLEEINPAEPEDG